MWVYYHTNWRTPWENTLAYFPFVDDILDKVWNYTLNNNWNSKETIWYRFTSRADISVPSNITPKTVSAWVKPISSWGTYSDVSICSLPNFTWYYIKHVQNRLNQKYITFIDSNYNAETANASVSFNQWYLFTTVYGESKSYWYINWVKILESSHWYRGSWNWVGFWSDTQDWTSNYNNWQCILSEWIIENVPRTENNVKSYYNQTCTNYWLQPIN